MSTFWHKMSDLKPVCSINMWKLTEKSYFCALSVTFLRLVCILKLEGLLQGCVKWKNTMTFNVNFLTQNWPTEKSYFCALSVTFLRLVCILKLEGLLQGCVKWKNTMTFNVNFLTQNVGYIFLVCILKLELQGCVKWKNTMTIQYGLGNLYGDIDRKIIFLCPLRYIFEASVHFKVGRSPSRLC